MAVTRNSASKQTASTAENSKTKNHETKNKINKTESQQQKKKTTRSESDSDHPQQQQLSSSKPVKRVKSPGVRLIGGRIYDSENGKTCHQCRQKTMDFAVSRKNQIENQQCTFYFCHKCLLNRYGEKAEEVAELGDWKCPKCRDVCNCGKCMKKRGFYPTGIFVHTAKANGFSSVSDMLNIKDSGKAKKEEGASSKKRTASNEERAVGSKKRHIKGKGLEGKGLDGKNDSKYQAKPYKMKASEKETRNIKLKISRKAEELDNSLEGTRNNSASIEKISTNSKEVPKKREIIYGRANGGRLIKMNSEVLAPTKVSTKSTRMEANETEISNKVNRSNAAAKNKQVNEFNQFKKNTVEVQGKDSVVEIPLPQGIELASLVNINLPAEDIGHALQFLEFCEAFGQVFDLKKGQPELLLRELACDRSSRRKLNPSLVQFHIKLLSMIQEKSGKEYSFLKTRGRILWLEALRNYISESQYPSKELLLDCFDVGLDGYEQLNSSKKLCLLNFLCDEALGTPELRSWIDEQNSEFVLAEKEKEKNMKKKLQNEVAKAIIKTGSPLSISEHENLVLKVKTEVAQTLAKTLPKEKQRSDAVRSEPILMDANGRIFWKLRGYPGRMDILLQDVGNGDLITFKERWFAYDVQEKEMVEKYISASRETKSKKERAAKPL